MGSYAQLFNLGPVYTTIVTIDHDHHFLKSLIGWIWVFMGIILGIIGQDPTGSSFD
jgi:hypothetical protein